MRICCVRLKIFPLSCSRFPLYQIVCSDKFINFGGFLRNLINKDTGNITELINKYNEAKASKAPNIDEIKNQLKDALIKYVNSISSVKL